MKKIVIVFTTIIVVMSLMVVYSFQLPQDNGSGQTLWYQVTVVESVVPGGLGRSRMIALDENGKMVTIPRRMLSENGRIYTPNREQLRAMRRIKKIRHFRKHVMNEYEELLDDDFNSVESSSGIY